MRFNFMALETLPVVIFIIRRKPKVYLLRKPPMADVWSDDVEKLFAVLFVTRSPRFLYVHFIYSFLKWLLNLNYLDDPMRFGVRVNFAIQILFDLILIKHPL
jgi:hypothetical protein